jgi:hypothetical protein
MSSENQAQLRFVFLPLLMPALIAWFVYYWPKSVVASYVARRRLRQGRPQLLLSPLRATRGR